MSPRSTISLALLFLASCLSGGYAQEDRSEDAKAAQERARDNEELRRKLSEAAAKLDQEQRKWEAAGKKTERVSGSRGEKGESKEDKIAEEARKKARKAAEDEEKERKKAREKTEKEEKDLKHSSKSKSDDEYHYASAGDERGRARVSTGSYSVPEGGWVEMGGLSKSTNFSASSPGSSVREGGSSNTSIGVRATVIRLDGPE